ncbi:hypothetical protein BOTCAL_0302g00090 [Botryotinia calthae]|uniref:Uncharacterized protein n=1 Tax=Botryotinia calthae TaxID=38488 RepID=A0A4Y8CX47_9HELO|nr:hypothetical protein BOTCAL_0302g00090 [Botryotinia calthae]
MSTVAPNKVTYSTTIYESISKSSEQYSEDDSRSGGYFEPNDIRLEPELPDVRLEFVLTDERPEPEPDDIWLEPELPDVRLEFVLTDERLEPEPDDARIEPDLAEAWLEPPLKNIRSEPAPELDGVRTEFELE